MQLVRPTKMPDELIPLTSYRDAPRVLRAFELHGQQCVWRMAEVFESAGDDFPLLRSADVRYLEISSSDVDKMDLLPVDAELLKNVATTGAIATVPPVVIVALDSFEHYDDEERRIVATHELVHAEQAVRGSLKPICDGRQQWDGTWYDNVASINQFAAQGNPAAQIEYLNLPWEKEAYVRSEGVAAHSAKFQLPWCRLLAQRHCENRDQIEEVGAAIAMLIRAVINLDVKYSGAEVLEDEETVLINLQLMGFPATKTDAEQLLYNLEQHIPSFRDRRPLTAATMSRALVTLGTMAVQQT